MTEIKCNSCTACCKNFQAIFLHPECGDDPSAHPTKASINPVNGKPMLILEHKENGDCIYLGEKGCGIYENRPRICRDFDCRKQYLMLTNVQRNNYIPADIQAAAKKRLGSLSGEERLKAIARRKTLNTVRYPNV